MSSPTSLRHHIRPVCGPTNLRSTDESVPQASARPSHASSQREIHLTPQPLLSNYGVDRVWRYNIYVMCLLNSKGRALEELVALG